MEEKIINTCAYFCLFLGFIAGIIPFIKNTSMGNLYFALAIMGCVFAWVIANLAKGSFRNDGDWKERKVLLITVGLCTLVGVSLLSYYEIMVPRTDIKLAGSIEHFIPNNYSKKQLSEMGAECNTYGNTKCSLAVFKRMFEIDPNDKKSFANFAMAQSKLGQHKVAISNLNKAIEMGVATYDVYLFLGESYLNTGKSKEAVEAFEKALELNPSLTETRSKVDALKALLKGKFYQ